MDARNVYRDLVRLRLGSLTGGKKDGIDSSMIVLSQPTAARLNTRALLGPLSASAPLDESSISIQGSVVRKLSNFEI